MHISHRERVVMSFVEWKCSSF